MKAKVRIIVEHFVCFWFGFSLTRHCGKINSPASRKRRRQVHLLQAESTNSSAQLHAFADSKTLLTRPRSTIVCRESGTHNNVSRLHRLPKEAANDSRESSTGLLFETMVDQPIPSVPIWSGLPHLLEQK